MLYREREKLAFNREGLSTGDFLIGCGGDSNTDLAADQELDSVKLLAEIELEGSSIQFYGADDGEGFVSEIGKVSEERRITPEMENLSFTQIHAEIAPELMIPQTIVDFDDIVNYFSEEINQARLDYDQFEASFSANTDSEQAQKSDTQPLFAGSASSQKTDHTKWFTDRFGRLGYSLFMDRSTRQKHSGRAKISNWSVWAETTSVNIKVDVSGRGRIFNRNVPFDTIWAAAWVRSGRSFWTGRYFTRTHEITVVPFDVNGKFHIAARWTR